METEYNYPGNDLDNNKWNKEQEQNAPNNIGADKDNLENRGPNNSKPFNVLNQDGSLPDMPDENVEGKGALDGTVGLGT